MIEVYGVEVRADGVREVQRNLEDVANQADRSAKAFDQLKKSIETSSPPKNLKTDLKSALQTINEGTAAIGQLKTALASITPPPAGVIRRVYVTELREALVAVERFQTALNRLSTGKIGSSVTISAGLTGQIERIRKSLKDLETASATTFDPLLRSFRYAAGALPSEINKVIATAQSVVNAKPILLTARVQQITPLNGPIPLTQLANQNLGPFLAAQNWKASTDASRMQSVIFTMMMDQAKRNQYLMNNPPPNMARLLSTSWNVRGNWGEPGKESGREWSTSDRSAGWGMYLNASSRAQLGNARKEFAITGEVIDQAGKKATEAAKRHEEHKQAMERGSMTAAALVRQLWYLNNAFDMLMTFMFLRQMKGWIDGWIGMSNSIRLSTKSTEEATTVQQKLFDVAQATRQPMEDIVVLYRRASLATNNLGASQNEMVDFTKAVGYALGIQGTSIEAARGSLLQLGQLLGMAKIRMQEFTSISENAPRILMSVAKAIDGEAGSVASLRSRIEQANRRGMGKLDVKSLLYGTENITVDAKRFFAALLEDLPNLEAEFAKVRPTIGQAFTYLDNALGRYMGHMNEAQGISTKFALSLRWLADNIDTVVKSLAILATVVVTLVAPTALGWLGKALMGIPGLFAPLIAGVKMFGNLLSLAPGIIGTIGRGIVSLGGPIGLAVVAITAMVAAISLFGDKIVLSRKEGITLGDVFDGIGKKIKAVFSWIGDKLGSILQQIKNGIGAALGWTPAKPEEAPVSLPQQFLPKQDSKYGGLYQGKYAKYADYFIKYGNENGISPYLLAAVGMAESGLRPDATSFKRDREGNLLYDSSGNTIPVAHGMMQGTVDTASKLGFSKDDLYEPEKAISFAAKLLANLTQQSKGQLDILLALYNGAPIRKLIDGTLWDVRKQGVPLRGTTPTDETQDYIPRVLKYYNELKQVEGSVENPVLVPNSPLLQQTVAPAPEKNPEFGGLQVGSGTRFAQLLQSVYLGAGAQGQGGLQSNRAPLIQQVEGIGLDPYAPPAIFGGLTGPGTIGGAKVAKTVMGGIDKPAESFLARVFQNTLKNTSFWDLVFGGSVVAMASKAAEQKKVGETSPTAPGAAGVASTTDELKKETEVDTSQMTWFEQIVYSLTRLVKIIYDTLKTFVNGTIGLFVVMAESLPTIIKHAIMAPFSKTDRDTLLKDIGENVKKASSTDFLGKAFSGVGEALGSTWKGILKIGADRAKQRTIENDRQEGANLDLKSSMIHPQDQNTIDSARQSLLQHLGRVNPTFKAEEEMRETLAVIFNAMNVEGTNFQRRRMAEQRGQDTTGWPGPLANRPMMPQDWLGMMSQTTEHYKDQVDPASKMIRERERELELMTKEKVERRGLLREMDDEKKLRQQLGVAASDSTIQTILGLDKAIAKERELRMEIDRLVDRMEEPYKKVENFEAAAPEALLKYATRLGQSQPGALLYQNPENVPLTQENQLKVLKMGNRLKEEQIDSRIAAGQGTFSDGFLKQLEIFSNKTRDIGANFGKIFATPITQAMDGVSDAIGRAVVYGENLGQALRGVAQTILSSLISAIVRMGLQLVMSAALGGSATASMIGMAASVAAAWAPAATLVSVGTMGLADAAGTTGLLTTYATAKGIAASSMAGWQSGGYTGDYRTDEVVGVVHGREYVMNAAATKRNRTLLEALNRGATSGSSPSYAGNASIPKVTVNNYSQARIDVEYVSPDEVRIIAQQEARRTVYRESEKVVASSLNDPNSRFSRALTTRTQTTRKRS